MVQVDKANMTDELGIPWELGYYVNSLDLNDGQKAYGISIECVGPGGRVSEETCGLTHSFEAAEGLAKRMSLGSVTAVSLHDVVDDFVG